MENSFTAVKQFKQHLTGKQQKKYNRRTHSKNGDTFFKLQAHSEFVEFFIIYSYFLSLFSGNGVGHEGDLRCQGAQSIQRQIKCVNVSVCLLRILPIAGYLKLKHSNRSDNLLIRLWHNINRMVTKICSILYIIHGICHMLYIDEPQIQISHFEPRHTSLGIK